MKTSPVVGFSFLFLGDSSESKFYTQKTCLQAEAVLINFKHSESQLLSTCFGAGKT